MKTFLTILIAVCAAGMAWAGQEPMPTVESDPDPTGAFILLGLVAMVVVLGGGGLATRNQNNLEIRSTDADDNAGF